MEDYKSNSHKAKETKKEDRNVQKVVTGMVKAKKESEAKKLANAFLSEDAEKVKTYILQDILIPAIKKAISDIFSNGVDMLLYGEPSKNKKKSASNVSYRSYYDGERERNYQPRRRGSYNFNDYIIDNRGEAEEVLSRMDELIATYGVVSVADFYELLGVSNDYTDYKYGWTDIRSASVVRVRDGYVIKLPKAFPID